MSVDQEMSPEEEAAAHADFVKAYDEMVPQRELVRMATPDNGQLHASRTLDGQRLLMEMHRDGEGHIIDATRYHVSDAGELVDLETHTAAPNKAVEFAKELRNPKLI